MPDPVSVDRLREATMDDPEFMAELVEMFVTDAESQVVALQQGIEAEQWPAVARTAHRLRGACSNVGAEQLAHMCADIEHQAGGGAPVESSMAGDVQAEFGRVRTALKDCVATAQDGAQ